MLHAELHIVERHETKQTEVGKPADFGKDREHWHCCLQFRIGHQRQIDQTFDRAPVEALPYRLVFGMDLLVGRMSWNVDAEQLQAC